MIHHDLQHYWKTTSRAIICRHEVGLRDRRRRPKLAAIAADGTIYVGSNDRKLYALKPDGTKKWEFETGDKVQSSPALDSDGKIYFGSLDNKLYAVKPNGTKEWEFATDGVVTSSPAIGSDGTIYFGSWDHKFYALKPDGTKKWSSRLTTRSARLRQSAPTAPSTLAVRTRCTPSNPMAPGIGSSSPRMG
jgi:outer membrane protein assembly factor BamB